jgi:putative endonuclease
VQNKCYTYMVECRNGSLYTGITDNLIRRMEEHKKGIGARYIRMYGYKSVAYVEEHPNRGTAMKRENYIKTLPKKEKVRIALEEAEKTKHFLERWGLISQLSVSFDDMRKYLIADIPDDGSFVIRQGDVDDSCDHVI